MGATTRPPRWGNHKRAQAIPQELNQEVSPGHTSSAAEGTPKLLQTKLGRRGAQRALSPRGMPTTSRTPALTLISQGTLGTSLKLPKTETPPKRGPQGLCA